MNKNVVCHVVCYKDPDYIRGYVIRRVLKKYRSSNTIFLKNKYKGIYRYFEITIKLICTRITHNPDIYILGFRGHEYALIFRILTFGKIMILDNLVSPYLSMRYESNSLSQQLIAFIIYPFELLIYYLSDFIIVDTNSHKSKMETTFDLDENKISKVFVGAKVIKYDDLVNTPMEFSVLFYGSFLPLHGANVIFEVCKSLSSYPIKFILIGAKKANYISNNVEIIQWLDYPELIRAIKNSSLCLGGPFGNTPQSLSVVTGKTYQILALGKPVIIGKTDEKHGFIDKLNCLLVQQDSPHELHKSILWAYKNKNKLHSIGEKGKQLYDQKFNDKVIYSQLSDIFERYES